MKKELQGKASFNVFINDSALIILENGPKLYVDFHIIAYPLDNGNWGHDSEVMDITKVEFMGATIEDHKEMRKFIEYFSSMGIKLLSEAEKQVDEIMAGYGSTEQYIKERIGLDVTSK